MKWCLISLLLTCFKLGSAQVLPPYSPAVNKQFVLEVDTFSLDTLPIVKGTIKINQYIEGIDYTFNYYTSTFINIKIPKQSLLVVQYTPLTYVFPSNLARKSISLIQPEFLETVNPFKLQPNKNGFSAIGSNEGLQTSGSIMRGLSIGNTQNAIINANLNLQLAGKLNNEIDVLAAISDENNPIQPEGNTQELQDFDQVFIQFSKQQKKLLVGDYLMSKPEPGYFLNYYKKSRGLATYNSFQLKDKTQLQVNAQAALSRGRFVRNIIQGQEGNQGPYRLQGANAELFIIIISGTESVYLDGQKLTRGEQNDYTIDYNTGEIVFMPKRLITQFSRIIVEFQYADRNFARTVLGVNTEWQSKKAKVYLNYFTEQDNKNQPFQQNLSDSNKLLLSRVGDQLQAAKILSELPTTQFNVQSILYKKIDTLGYTGVYVHTKTKGNDSVFYEVRFSFVGNNKGNYKQGASAANGRVFVWVEPINGVPQGDFEPVIQLIAPNQQQMLSVGAVYQWKAKQLIKIEAAKSIFNKNLFSELDKQNDAGYALNLVASNEINLGKNGSKILTELNYEYTTAQFKFIERYRNVEFNRIWNRQLGNVQESENGNNEHILNGKIKFQSLKNGFIHYQIAYYNKNEHFFTGLNQILSGDLIQKKNRLQVQLEQLSGDQKALMLPSESYQTSVENVQLIYTRDFNAFHAGGSLASEKSEFKRSQDSLLGGSFSFQKYTLFLRSKDSSSLRYYAELNIRLDQLPFQEAFRNNSLAKEATIGLDFLQKNFNKLNIDISFRDFQLLDTSNQLIKPERILLSRITYDYAFFKRLITANTYVQLGSGNELRRDYQFLEVPTGQGIYVWKDFNEDGLQQINEFQVASFADKNIANYLKVFLPTTSLVSVQSTQFSQTLNLNTYSAKNYYGLKGFLNKFSNQAALRLERKLTTADFNPLANAMRWSWDDTSIVSLSSFIRNTLFFNRNNPKYGLDFAYIKQRSKAFQTNGFESRDKLDYTIGGRYAFNANWILTGAYVIGEKRNASEFFSNNDFRYTYVEYKPKLSYQYQQTWRVSLDYSHQIATNLPELGGESSMVKQAGLEMRYSFIKIGVITSKFSFFDVEYAGNLNAPVAYDMLQGLSRGKNQLLSVQLQQRIGQNLQINMSYEGRKSGDIPFIHAGKMEARYLF